MVIPHLSMGEQRDMTDSPQRTHWRVSVSIPSPSTARTRRKPSWWVKAFREGRAPASPKSYKKGSGVRSREGQCPGWGSGNQIVGEGWHGVSGGMGGGEVGVKKELGHHWL